MVYGDRGYRGCEGVIVCDSKDMRAKRQVVEGVISQIKLFNAGSGWRTLTCVRVYLQTYLGYSSTLSRPLGKNVGHNIIF